MIKILDTKKTNIVSLVYKNYIVLYIFMKIVIRTVFFHFFV